MFLCSGLQPHPPKRNKDRACWWKENSEVGHPGHEWLPPCVSVSSAFCHISSSWTQPGDLKNNILRPSSNPTCVNSHTFGSLWRGGVGVGVLNKKTWLMNIVGKLFLCSFQRKTRKQGDCEVFLWKQPFPSTPPKPRLFKTQHKNSN